LFRAGDAKIDRKALANLLAQIACEVRPELGAHADSASPDPRLEQLRTLLVGREIQIVDRLCDLIEDPQHFAAAIGRALPDALARAAEEDRLSRALAPILENATQNSVRKDPRTLINILYPLIVPAIRKSIGETIDDTFQSLNESLKHSLTWRGLRWRWEAWRTGTSFSEVVLRHTLAYRVEHVFLIDRHRGLLMAHVAANDASSQDPQLVSSMLMAIQDFVRDSFTGTEHQGLDALRFGELRLWSEPGPLATLVAVIRGNPPEGVHHKLQQLLSSIHAQYSDVLEKFDGDSAALGGVEEHLKECLALRQEVPQSELDRGFPWRVAAVGAVLLLGLGFWWLWSRHAQRLWDGYLATLRGEPGIVVTAAGREGGHYVVNGLRDPLASDPKRLALRSGLTASDVIGHWGTYQSFDPQIVLRRLVATIPPPTTISMAVQNGRVVASGSASSAWLAQARSASRQLPAGFVLDLSHVSNLQGPELSRLHESIQACVIHFSYNEPLPAAGQEAVLDELALELEQLFSLSPGTRVALTGHSDATGRGTFNLSLSLARAEAVRALLKRRGVDPDQLSVRAAGPLEPEATEASEEGRSLNRRVSFTVISED
jgi:OOP family OmpA-OmpF porin